MDNNKGSFEGISLEKFAQRMMEQDPRAFREKEILEIRGSRFLIESIKKKRMVLKLLPAPPQNNSSPFRYMGEPGTLHKLLSETQGEE